MVNIKSSKVSRKKVANIISNHNHNRTIANIIMYNAQRKYMCLKINSIVHIGYPKTVVQYFNSTFWR